MKDGLTFALQEVQIKRPRVSAGCASFQWRHCRAHAASFHADSHRRSKACCGTEKNLEAENAGGASGDGVDGAHYSREP